MTAGHTHLTPDLPPLVETPDLPGAQRPGRTVTGRDGEGDADGEDGRKGAGQDHGAHHAERDGRHESAGQDSGG
ncbi:hypothetical protein [Streptomyces sp. NPDC008001]|uniref:hypothetical protein n=1 Tax=Streptomyces sp. NPDC008001 TaxID=3364804 RepID=UPI0036F1496A